MIKFGTDGWRAIIGQEFNEGNVSLVTQAFADFLRERDPRGVVFLGYDRRTSSQEMAQLASEILAANEFEVRLSSSYCPTPCISWNTRAHKARAGMMVTASHNPPEWNGIKFKEPDGGSAPPESTKRVEEGIEKNSRNPRWVRRIPLSEAREKGRVVLFDPHEEYLRAMQKMVNLPKIQEAGWRIGYDPLYGAGAGFLGHLIGKDLVEIHANHDPQFGGLNPEPIERNLKEFLRTIREKRLDVGFSTDGDVDRIGAVDEEGRFVDSHHIYALMLRHLVTVRKEKGEIVKTVSTTHMIDQLAERYGLKVHEVPIGFKHICKRFREVHPLMGGEESGGIAYARWMPERDGLFCALLLLEVMTHEKKRLGELIQELHREIGPHFSEREDLRLPPAEMEKVRSNLSSKKIDQFAGQKVKRVNRLDGLKLIFSDESWLLIRPSGTEPLLRIYAESSSPDQVKRLLKEAKGLL